MANVYSFKEIRLRRSAGVHPYIRALAFYGTLFALAAGALILFTGTHHAEDYVASQSFHSSHQHRPGPSHRHPKKPAADQTDWSWDPAADTSTETSWEFDYGRDGRNYGLSEEQCSIAFPDFYREIDRAVDYRKDEGKPIKLEEVDVAWRGDGIVRAMIHNNEFYIIDAHSVTDHNHRPRTIATLHSIHRAVSAYPGKLPDIEFSFTVHDSALLDSAPNATTWAFTRKAHQETLWLMPDFGMWGWPDVGLRSYAEFQTVLDHEEDDFLDKIPKLVWRGSLAVGSQDVRHGLVDHSREHDWSDVQTLDWSNKTEIEERLLSMVDHCAYMFVAQTEGNTYSGRLKYLLNCNSILFSHDLTWVELYHHLMTDSGPDQNFIKVKRDYSDLPSKMKSLIDPGNWIDAQRIAENARRTFRERYLTPAAEACYWRALIRGWASVQDFTPDFWHEVEEYDKVSKTMKLKRKPRGAPFESYAIMEEVNWDLPAKPRKMCIEENPS